MKQIIITYWNAQFSIVDKTLLPKDIEVIIRDYWDNFEGNPEELGLKKDEDGDYYSEHIL